MSLSLFSCISSDERDTSRLMRESHLAFNMATPTSAVKFSDIYELKEELGK